LELPTNGWLRRYRVRVHGAVDERQLAYLSRGITIEGVAYGPIEAGLDSRQGANAWLTVSLKEGKNREIRRVMAHLGLQVTRLIRMAYGPFQLGALPRGGVEEVHPRILRDQLGIGEKPQRSRAAAEPAAESPPPEPKPTGPSRGHTIPRARNAAPRRPTRAQNRRRPPSRP
jgi:23S rRNA pseudouridine2605 synthase